MTLITLAGGVALVAGVMGLMARRNLQSAADAVEAAWRHVQLFLEVRHDLARRLATYAAPDTPALLALQAVLQQAEFTSGLAMKARVENQLTSSLSELAALGGNESFTQAMAALSGADAAIERTAADYNAVVEAYNAALRRSPSSARFFRYEPAEPFAFTHCSHLQSERR